MSASRQRSLHLKSILKITTTFFAALFLISFSGLLISPQTACADPERRLYAKVESFTWKEFLGNRMLLKESGPLYGLGFSDKVGGNISQPFAFHYKVEGFMGYIGYDGHTQSGVPIKTNTRYAGFKTEIDGGWNIFAGDSGFSFEPFAGLGYRWWLRDITDSSSGIGSGYEEIWKRYYGRLGVCGEKITSGQFKIFMGAAVIIPFYNENKVSLGDFGLGDVKVEPGNKTSFWAELGMKSKKFRGSIFYEGLRFSESDRVGRLKFFQPESEADIYGVNMGVIF